MKNKVWFITGASKGFGFEIAKTALAAGDKVVATVRKNVKELTTRLNNEDNALVVTLDVTSEEEVKAGVNAAIRRFGRIDVLVNNAGYGLLAATEEASAEEVRKQYDTNVFGLLNVTRAVLPYLRNQGSGHIINISSLFGYQNTVPGFGLYGSTKYAVEGITEGLALELKPLGIHVTAAAPGLFSTEFTSTDSYQNPGQILDAYKDTVGGVRTYMSQLHGNQPGDPAKLGSPLGQHRPLSFFAYLPPMKYKLLGRSGLKVSELCLGTMGFGTEAGWGADKETSFAIMEAFAGAGGNFLDTANVYKLGTSEKIIGEFVQSRDRDYFVIATKYSLKDNTTNPNASGNNRKNMMRSVEQSLKRLQTDFIDILYLHIWDDLTPIDEVLRGIDDLIRQGKVNYAAISDTPAWIVSKGNTLAELMGWSQFIALQVEYSLLQRSPERDLIPMANHYGMTVTPWAPLAGGALTGKYLRGGQGRIKPESNRRDENSIRITREVMAVADKLGVEPSHVALQWTRQQGFECIPIVGATRLDQLHDNLKMVDLVLPEEDLKRLDEASAIDLGFPGKFFREEGVKQNNFGGFYDRIVKR